jgi:hypothetical protein
MSNSTADPESRKEIRCVKCFLSQLFSIQLLFANYPAPDERRSAVRTLIARVLRYKIGEQLRERFIQSICMAPGSKVDVSAILVEERRKSAWEPSRRRRK